MKDTLDNLIEQRSRNLQLIKFIAAMLVIVSHAYPITLGTNETEPLLQLTKGQLSFGGLAVGIFFFSGGFFIAQSVERKHTAKAFFAARCRRIFPALLLTVVLTIFLGGWLTTLSFKEYVTNAGTWKYLLNGIMIPIHDLPGVFEQQPYLPTANGALWTLPVEFACYIGCFIAFRCRLLTVKGGAVTGGVVVAGVMGTLFLQNHMPGMVTVLRPCLLFGIGMLYWIYRKWIPISGMGSLTASLLFVISLVVGAANVGMYLFLPYALIGAAYLKYQVPEQIAGLGKLSYGIYLCGFPVQQTVCFLSLQKHSLDGILPDEMISMMPVQNMLLSIPIAWAIGYGIYKLTQ